MAKFNNFLKVKKYFLNEDYSKINSWREFYIFISSFYEENRSLFSKEDIWAFDIENVVGLNPDDWLSEVPEQSLESEKKLLLREFNGTSHLLMRIKNFIDNMLTSYSERECSITGDYFRFIAVEESNGKRCMLLECPTCYRIETLSGEHVKKINGEVFPVSKAEIKELEKNNVRILK